MAKVTFLNMPPWGTSQDFLSLIGHTRLGSSWKIKKSQINKKLSCSTMEGPNSQDSVLKSCTWKYLDNASTDTRYFYTRWKLVILAFTPYKNILNRLTESRNISLYTPFRFSVYTPFRKREVGGQWPSARSQRRVVDPGVLRWPSWVPCYLPWRLGVAVGLLGAPTNLPFIRRLAIHV